MITFKLNKQEVSVDALAGTPLLWVIRDELKKKGTKFGCGKGLCGACSVLLDGEVIRSCVTPVEYVAGRSITTIEGLSENGEHPIQKAWVSEDVAQCGYCQPGQIISAVALLDSNPNPSDDQINQAMRGNICRCGTYQRIKRAIKKVASQN